MASVRNRRRERHIDYWPGFVDALSTLLLVFVFLLCIFVVAQFFLTREVAGKDNVLQRLNAQLAELTEVLALERSSKRTMQEELSALQANLATVQQERDALRGSAGGGLEEQKRLSAQALSQVELLNQQIAALRRQIAALEEALQASESQNKESQTKIADLGARLNVALAQRVQELSKYRSEFFGRLRTILADRPDIRVVGDRFVFQSEVFFDTGRADLSPAGTAEVDKLAAALLDLEKQIPSDLPWVLRVDGHTDVRPINSPQFPSNWSLSAARAIAVVQRLVEKGVSPQHLVAAGFGEFQPLDTAENEDAYRKNRRLELKLTER